MARGKAEFSQMKPFTVDVRDDIPKNKGGKVDLNMKESMQVKGLSNANFQTSMGIRNTLRSRKFNNKPIAPKMPNQGVPSLQGSPGKIPTMTPPSMPIGGRKPQTKGLAATLAKSVLVPATIGVIAGDIANRVQDKRGADKEKEKKRRNRNKGFLMDTLEGE